MNTNIHLRNVDEKTMQLLKTKSSQEKISVNTLILSLIRKGLGIPQDRNQQTFHDLDKFAGTWNQHQAKEFIKSLKDFEKIDKDMWK